jgi:DNA invertase Pin-like site-specific DNA recombinase
MQSGRSKAAIYVRVSTADQHVESQLYDLRELAVQRGLEVGYSGEGEQRFRREAERHSGAKVNSSRSVATLAW